MTFPRNSVSFLVKFVSWIRNNSKAIARLAQIARYRFAFHRHSGESRNPESRNANWIPNFRGNDDTHSNAALSLLARPLPAMRQFKGSLECGSLMRLCTVAILHRRSLLALTLVTRLWRPSIRPFAARNLSRRQVRAPASASCRTPKRSAPN